MDILAESFGVEAPAVTSTEDSEVLPQGSTLSAFRISVGQKVGEPETPLSLLTLQRYVYLYVYLYVRLRSRYSPLIKTTVLVCSGIMSLFEDLSRPLPLNSSISAESGQRQEVYAPRF